MCESLSWSAIKKSKNSRWDFKNWLTFHTIPSVSACFELEHLWPDKVHRHIQETAEVWFWFCVLRLLLFMCALTEYFWLILTAVFIHIPSLNVSKKQAGMTAIIINVRRYIFVQWFLFKIFPHCHLLKRFVLNLLFSDVGLSGCTNSLNHVKITLVNMALVVKKKPKKKSQAPLIGIHACLLENILKFTAARVRLISLFSALVI